MSVMDVTGNFTNKDWNAVVGVGEQVVLTCLGVLMAVVGVVGNWMVVALATHALPVRSSFNLLLACLALCDGISSSLLLPLEVFSFLGKGKLLPASCAACWRCRAQRCWRRRVWTGTC